PPRVVSGDEPHYLLATNALLQGDGFCLQKAYRRALRGELDAGLRAAGHPLDHHTLLLLPSGSPVRWLDAYQSWIPRDCPHPGCTPFAPRSLDYDDVPGVCEVSTHPFAFALLSAALVRPFATEPAAVARIAITRTAVLGWLATLAVFGAARACGLSRPWSLAATGVCALASPLLAYGRSFFPEAAIACALSVAAWMFFARRPVLAGVAC